MSDLSFGIISRRTIIAVIFSMVLAQGVSKDPIYSILVNFEGECLTNSVTSDLYRTDGVICDLIHAIAHTNASIPIMDPINWTAR